MKLIRLKDFDEYWIGRIRLPNYGEIPQRRAVRRGNDPFLVAYKDLKSELLKSSEKCCHTLALIP